MAQCAIVDNGACGAHILPIHDSRFYNFFLSSSGACASPAN